MVAKKATPPTIAEAQFIVLAVGFGVAGKKENTVIGKR
jgi:hypothetical protein